MVNASKASAFLPLTPAVFHVLLALADEDRHGYGIILEVDERTGGEVRLRTGTLYTILARLLEDTLVAETAARLADKDDPRRKYYTLTPLGHTVVRAEAQRLERLLALAHDKRVLPAASKGRGR
jgi:DNA-binding PadR family transcriptional regulator